MATTLNPRETSREAADLLAPEPPIYEVSMVCVPPQDAFAALPVRTRWPEAWAVLSAEEQRIAERRAQHAGGWSESAICYRLPTDVLELVDAVALCQEWGFEVVTKGTAGDPTLLRVLTRPLAGEAGAWSERTVDEYRLALGVEDEG